MVEVFADYLELAPDDDAYRAAAHVLDKNLIHGDALTIRTSEDLPTTFPEWGYLGKGRFQRRVGSRQRRRNHRGQQDADRRGRHPRHRYGRHLCDPVGAQVRDFHLLVQLRVFNTEQMNQAVFAFRRYEDASLRCTGIESHEGLTHYGLYDTVVAKDAYGS